MLSWNQAPSAAGAQVQKDRKVVSTLVLGAPLMGNQDADWLRSSLLPAKLSKNGGCVKRKHCETSWNNVRSTEKPRPEPLGETWWPEKAQTEPENQRRGWWAGGGWWRLVEANGGWWRPVETGRS